jgi:hypothetical protein
MAKEEKTSKILPVEWYIPDDLVPRYATNIVVQHSQYEFTLSFFAAQNPIILGTMEERKKAVEKLQGMRAKCVAQIIINPERMKDFISVMEANFKIFEEKTKKQENGD